MKLVSAVIRPEKLEEVRRALGFAYVTGLTVTEVLGFGRQRGHANLYRGAEYRIEFRPKQLLEMAVLERDVSLPVVGKPGTPVLFDAGVYLTVLGVVLLILLTLQEEDEA